MNWDLTYHFKTQEEFEKAFEEGKKLIASLGSYKGKLHEPESFKEYYLLQKKLEEELFKVYQYASLKSDLNKKDVANATSIAKCRMALYGLNELTSFEAPELIIFYHMIYILYLIFAL